jgi:hypothetical protein
MYGGLLTGTELRALVQALGAAAGAVGAHGFDRAAMAAEAARLAGAEAAATAELGALHAAALGYASDTVEALTRQGYAGYSPEQLRALAARVSATG